MLQAPLKEFEKPSLHPEQILDELPDSLIYLSPFGEILYSNQNFKKSYDLEEIQQKPTCFYSLLKNETAVELKTALSILERGQSPVLFNLNNKNSKHSNTNKNECWTLQGFYDSTQKLQYVQCQIKNVPDKNFSETQYNEQYAKLKEAKALLRLVIDNVPSRIWLKDNKNKIIKLNKAAAESMGGEVYEFEGTDATDLFGAMAESYLQDDLEAINEGGKYGIIEEYIPYKGVTGWVQTDKIPLKTVESEQRLIVVSTDITEIVLKERELEEINHNLSQFSAMASHDLKAPLRHIITTTDIFKLTQKDILNKDILAYMDDISSYAYKMRDIIDCFLKFARAVPDKIEQKTINAHLLIQKIIEQHEAEKDIEPGMITLSDEPMWVQGDRDLLTQVFENLISNIIKYQSPERRLEAKIYIGEQKGHRTKVYFKDNGIGVHEKNSEKIFDIFARSKEINHVTGAGIGLAICKRLLVMCHGEINLKDTTKSKGGHHELGSCFIVTLNTGANN